jgi:hypothetical protein
VIQDELKTAFRWYNSIDKQNRFKSYCSASCDFKLLAPLNSVPNFQFNTFVGGVEVDVWRVLCAYDDTDMGGISPSLLSKNTIELEDYITYSGDDISSYIELGCGTYYCVLETNMGNFYSELFSCVDIEDPEDYTSELPIFTAWRFHDNAQKQNQFKSQCAANCDFFLITGYDLPLPFQFRFPVDLDASVERWVLRNETCEYVLNHNLIGIYNTNEPDEDDFTYVYYDGVSSPTPSENVFVPNGDFSGSGSWALPDSPDPSPPGTWAILSNQGRFTITGVGSSLFYNEDLNIESERVYSVTYTIALISGLGTGFRIVVGGTYGERRTTAGTYTELITASDDGLLQLYGEKIIDNPLGVNSGQIRIDDITLRLHESLPCGNFESVVTVGGVEYFSEWVHILADPGMIVDTNYLLQEDGYRILQEDGFGILIN